MTVRFLALLLTFIMAALFGLVAADIWQRGGTMLVKLAVIVAAVLGAAWGLYYGTRSK